MIRAILTPILCGIAISLIPTFEKGMILSPLIFGLVVSLVNFKKLKWNPFIGILSCTLISYAVLYLSIFLTLQIGELYGWLENSFGIKLSDISDSFSVLTGGIISAIILYWCYSFLFKNQRRINGILTILITALLIPLTVWLFSRNSNYSDNEDFAIYQISWLIFISLGFGIAINQLEIKSTLNKMFNRP